MICFHHVGLMRIIDVNQKILRIYTMLQPKYDNHSNIRMNLKLIIDGFEYVL